jgi:hypothetical protein
MSWFFYKEQPTRKRKGLWLRKRSLPEDLKEEINKKLLKNEEIDWIVVKEIKKGQVLLEIWCRPAFSTVFDRFSVIYHWTKENPEWVCEGDLGRGFKP